MTILKHFAGTFRRAQTLKFLGVFSNWNYFFIKKIIIFNYSVFKDQDIVTLTLPSTAAKQKYQKKMMQSAGGQTLSTTITKNLNPESGTEPAGTSHDEIGFQSCFEPANNEQ